MTDTTVGSCVPMPAPICGTDTTVVGCVPMPVQRGVVPDEHAPCVVALLCCGAEFQGAGAPAPPASSTADLLGLDGPSAAPAAAPFSSSFSSSFPSAAAPSAGPSAAPVGAPFVPPTRSSVAPPPVPSAAKPSTAVDEVNAMLEVGGTVYFFQDSESEVVREGMSLRGPCGGWCVLRWQSLGIKGGVDAASAPVTQGAARVVPVVCAPV